MLRGIARSVVGSYLLSNSYGEQLAEIDGEGLVCVFLAMVSVGELLESKGSRGDGREAIFCYWCFVSCQRTGAAGSSCRGGQLGGAERCSLGSRV